MLIINEERRLRVAQAWAGEFIERLAKFSDDKMLKTKITRQSWSQVCFDSFLRQNCFVVLVRLQCKLSQISHNLVRHLVLETFCVTEGLSMSSFTVTTPWNIPRSTGHVVASSAPDRSLVKIYGEPNSGSFEFPQNVARLSTISQPPIVIKKIYNSYSWRNVFFSIFQYIVLKCVRWNCLIEKERCLLHHFNNILSEIKLRWNISGPLYLHMTYVQIRYTFSPSYKFFLWNLALLYLNKTNFIFRKIQ